MPKMLIIDDEIEMCDVLEDFFGSRGYETITAYQGQGGIDAYEYTHPDIVILDICLGDMSGFEVLRKIKKMDKNAKIIIVTGSAKDSDKAYALKVGCCEYMLKPVSFIWLYNTVTKLVPVKVCIHITTSTSTILSQE